MDSSNSSYRFVPVDGFTPNVGSPWTSFGSVSNVTRDSATGSIFTFTGESPGPGLSAPIAKIYVLGPAAFRVRFNPRGDYSRDGSYAVVNYDLGSAKVTVLSQDTAKISIGLGGDIRLDVLLQPCNAPGVVLNAHFSAVFAGLSDQQSMLCFYQFAGCKLKQ